MLRETDIDQAINNHQYNLLQLLKRAKERNVFPICLELNPDSSIVQLVAYSQYRLSYPSSTKVQT
jgi:hypothetical protein